MMICDNTRDGVLGQAGRLGREQHVARCAGPDDVAGQRDHRRPSRSGCDSGDFLVSRRRAYRDAERHAKRTRKSRSQLYAEALAEYLARHAPDHVTEDMNSVVDRLGETGPDRFVSGATRRVLASLEW